VIGGVATTLVAAAAALALGRVFAGNPATFRLLAAGLASAAVAVVMERRNLVAATLTSALGLAVAVGLLVFPDSTWYGLPTPETMRAAVDAAGLVGEQARVQVAPAPPLPPLMLAAVVGVWASVFASHALAVRAGSPLLALLPPIALVGFADSVLEEIVRPVFGLLFLVAAMAVLFADGMRRVQGWGPVWTGPGRAARLDVAAGRGARRVAGLAVVVAAAAPVLLPGFGSRGLVDFSTTDEDRVRIDPLVSVQSSLRRDEATPVFEVRTEIPLYWRMVALPNFDGRVWSPDQEPATIDVSAGSALETSTQPVGPLETTDVSFETKNELGLPWLPLPYPPRTTDADLEGMRWDPESGSILLEEGVPAGVTYTAVADVVRPTPAQLRAQPVVATAESARYTQVPPDLPIAISSLARQWTRGTGSAYDAVIAIQDRFTDPRYGFRYDVNVPGSSSDEAMVEFLTLTKVGFCQQFSSAMAVMLRSLGIPARLAVGFTPGSFSGSADRLNVTTENAHSWVEVFFPSFGWLPFEPTPNRQNTVGYPYLDPSTADECAVVRGGFCAPVDRGGGPRGTAAQGTAGITAAEREQARPGGLGAAGIRGGATTFGTANAAPDPGPWSARNGLLAALAGIVLVLVIVPPFRAWRRRRRLRRAGPDPRRLILTTYDVFTERAADLGHPRAPGQTIDEYRKAVTASGATSNGDLERLSRLARDAAYSPIEHDDGDARTASRAADSVLYEIRRRTPLVQRITGPYRRR
jgi:hypothetical protein